VCASKRTGHIRYTIPGTELSDDRFLNYQDLFYKLVEADQEMLRNNRITATITTDIMLQARNCKALCSQAYKPHYTKFRLKKYNSLNDFTVFTSHTNIQSLTQSIPDIFPQQN